MNSIQICNLSLMMIGMPSITSFDDANNNARMCKQFFPTVRDRILRDHCWSFATAYLDLNATTEESQEPAYPFVCAEPIDLIRILDVDDGDEYLHVGNRILTKRNGAKLKYIRRVEETEDFDTLFAEVMQYALAAEIIMTNTLDLQKINFYRGEYERRLAVARSIDSAENRKAMQPRPQRSNWIAARGNGGINSGAPAHFVEGNAGAQVTP